MTDHKVARTILVVMILGIVAVLGIYACEFLNTFAAIALVLIVLIAASYFSSKVWKLNK